MTDVKVVDASALAALLFGEAEAESIAREVYGARLAAPQLLDYELANVCLTKMRREPQQRGALRAAFALADTMQVMAVAVDRSAVLDLAASTGLTA